MEVLLKSIIIGITAGIIDIVPMIIQKLEKRAIASAFLQYFFVAIVILNINLPGITWWIQGGLISFCLALPVLLIVSHDEKGKKALPIIAAMSIVLGTLISVAGHFLI